MKRIKRMFTEFFLPQLKRKGFFIYTSMIVFFLLIVIMLIGFDKCHWKLAFTSIGLIIFYTVVCIVVELSVKWTDE